MADCTLVPANPRTRHSLVSPVRYLVTAIRTFAEEDGRQAAEVRAKEEEGGLRNHTKGCSSVLKAMRKTLLRME